MLTRSSDRRDKAKQMAQDTPGEYLRRSIPGQQNASWGIQGAMGSRGAFAYTAKSRVSTASQHGGLSR